MDEEEKERQRRFQAVQEFREFREENGMSWTSAMGNNAHAGILGYLEILRREQSSEQDGREGADAPSE